MLERRIKPEMSNTVNRNLKEGYFEEYSFITDLLNRARLPNAEIDYSDSDAIADEKNVVRSKDRVDENRAKSLEELRKRLAAVKAEKMTYRGLKIKNRIQSKLKRRKKIDENKSRRNALKPGGVTIRKTQNEIKVEDVKPPKPVFNSNGSLVFSKFDFLGETATVIDEKSTKGPINKKRILEKLQKGQNYLKKLEEDGDTEKAIQVRQETKWMNALRRSEGVRVKDNSQLLKKSLAKKQATKKASEKKWKERLKIIENKKIERQKKRKENIDKKIQQKKQKKIKKATKRGRFFAGV